MELAYVPRLTNVVLSLRNFPTVRPENQRPEPRAAGWRFCLDFVLQKEGLRESRRRMLGLEREGPGRTVKGEYAVGGNDVEGLLQSREKRFLVFNGEWSSEV